MEAKEATISKILEAGEEMPLLPATSTQAERLVSWRGFLFNERRLTFAGESIPMQLFLKDNIKLLLYL